MSNYDCTSDVLKHRERVAFWMEWIVEVLDARAKQHDESKLLPPEKEIFDQHTPKLKYLKFGGDEYESTLEKMGEGLKHHYQMNPHHPEHFKNGIDDMSIWDLIEMLADWMAAASVRNVSIDLDYLHARFGISPQLLNIIANTLYSADMDAINFRIPIEYQQINNFIAITPSNNQVNPDGGEADAETQPRVEMVIHCFICGGETVYTAHGKTVCYRCAVEILEHIRYTEFCYASEDAQQLIRVDGTTAPDNQGSADNRPGG